MKSKSLDFRQIEWWIVTSVFLSIFLFNLFSFRPDFYEGSGHEIFKFVSRLVIPMTLYISFHLVHYVLIPKYEKDKKVWLAIVLTVLIGVVSFFVVALLAYHSELSNSPFPTFYLGVVGIYVCYLIGAFILNQALTPPKIRDFQLYNIVRLILMYAFTLLFLIQTLQITNEGTLFVFGMIIPGILLLCLYHYYFVYKNKIAGRIKRARLFYWGLLGVNLLVFLIFSGAENEEKIFIVGLGITVFLMLILFPLAALVFNKYDSYLGQINTLTYKVDQGSANLDFLRSQINPHFLFNALNTLYASALIENAEKTADGVQKLGDMMRFMIHENQQDKIPLSREINYLRNYLDLQMLRFGKESKLEVDIQISEEMCQGDIAPMLLIPYLENAFKHGISLKEKSWIKLNLRCISGSVHLDLVNSVHPEKPLENSREESGIGLDNVKKRLDLVYPNKHQLNIIKNDSDFFVHLSIQLT